MNATLRFALIGVLYLATASIASAQPNPTIIVTVKYYPDRSLTPYDFGVQLTVFGDAALGKAVTIKAPDGTIYDTPSGSNYNRHEFQNLSATELNQYIGLWTINDYQDIPSGSAPQQHTFTVTQRELTDSPPVPRLTFPVNGSVLPPVFEFKASERSFRLQNIIGSGRLGWLNDPPVGGWVRYTFDPGVTESLVSMRTSAQNSKGGMASAPPSANRKFDVWKVNDTLSAPSIFTIKVPECATLGMACVGGLSLAALRRRK